MSTSCHALRFFWWNVQDFAHFDVTRSASPRWPKSREEYYEKRRRIETVLQLLPVQEKPALLGFAEITDEAAYDLRDRLFPNYRVYSVAGLTEKIKSHIALIYDPDVGLCNEELLTVSNVPDTTRPMALLDYRSTNNVIRFYFCHWTARFKDNSEKARQLSSLQLGRSVYQFLHPEAITRETRHVVIVGDLNEEPYGLLETWLYATRDRARSKSSLHYTDKTIERAYLYNCAWKLLGERNFHPHPERDRNVAGSYYWREERTWHTFDQIIVSGSLLGRNVPYLDEASIQIASSAEMLPDDFLADDKLPHRFNWNDGQPVGISDHLPLMGKIIVKKEVRDVCV